MPAASRIRPAVSRWERRGAGALIPSGTLIEKGLLPWRPGRPAANLLPMLPAYNPCVLRILVASPHPALRAGLKVLLAPRLEIVGEAATLAALFDEVRATRPAVIVFDLALEPDEAMAALWQLRAEWPALGVLALAESDADGRVLAALQAGARGCLPKTAEAAELSEAIENVALGRAVLPAAATASLIDQLDRKSVV